MPEHSRDGKLRVLTVGPDIKGQGGISSVLQAYARCFADFSYAATNSRHGSLGGALVLGGLLLKLPFYRLAGYKAIHAHGASRKSFTRKRIVLGWARILGFRTIFHCHGGGFRTFTAEVGRDRMQRFLDKYDAIGVLSEGWAEFFRDELKCRNVAVLPNIVEDSGVRSATPHKDEPMRLIFLGKVCREKGCFDLLEALASRRDVFGGKVEVLVGGTGETEAFDARAKELGVSNMIKMLGWVGPEKKASLIAEGGVMILPSYIEGMPVSLLEAGVAGMPSIATRVGAVDELIEDGANGILLEAGDTAALADAIASYLESPELRVAHGAEARKRITGHLPDAVHRALDNLYESIR